MKCTTNTSCVAVGTYALNYRYVGHALIEHWDGNQWSVVPSHGPAVDSELSSVKCVTASDCVAVGGPSMYSQMIPELSLVGRSFPHASPFIGSFPPFGHRLIEHWNGRTWSTVASLGPAATSNSELLGVSCATSTGCMAVGGFVPVAAHHVGPEKTLVEHSSSVNGNGSSEVMCNAMSDSGRAASAVFYANYGSVYPTTFGEMEHSKPLLLELPTGVTGTGKILTGHGWTVTMTGGGRSQPTFTCSVDSKG
ncbi:MAG: hypothetical protein ACLPVY_00145 [Acidimicrobiia bacterium]